MTKVVQVKTIKAKIVIQIQIIKLYIEYIVEYVTFTITKGHFGIRAIIK